MSTSQLDTIPDSQSEVMALLQSLRQQASEAATNEEMRDITARVASITRAYRIQRGVGITARPDMQAQEIDAGYVARPHVQYLSERVAHAVRDVERGHNRQMAVSMPPRAGKSTLLSIYTPLWLLRRHPEWKIVTASYDGGLTAAWAKQVRTIIEEKPELGISLARDGGAGSRWATREGGGIYATSTRGALTGRGARVIIIDDPVRDFVEAHSQLMRNHLWDWWLSVAQTRLEPPHLVLVVQTRWHEDDFMGRLLSPDYEGDPREWEKISLPAIAEQNDVLGRAPGEPLYSPLLDETEDEALDRWDKIKRSVGTYTFAGMYQQRPAPAKGAIFDSGWWRYWTSDPDRATADGRIVYLDPETRSSARWVDSWDCTFKGGTGGTGDWVVGQRWMRDGANRYLVGQQRARWTFTETIAAMKRWTETDNPVVSPGGQFVHERLIEDKANGSAIIDVLNRQISGLKPINPTSSKESRARAVTPEIESGNVYLPHPGDPGNEWVTDLLSELRNFPNDANDDQVDALTQALGALRNVQPGRATVPGRSERHRSVTRNITRAAASDTLRRTR